MEALDGNAIAGPLFEYFGSEMTAAEGTCAYCGASAMIGELRVFSRAPGAVVRCPSCGNVVMVLVTIRDTLSVELTGFRLVEAPADG
jgi:phage tail tape-measure protein